MLKKRKVVMLPTNQKAKKGDYYIGSFDKIAQCDNGTLKYADGEVLNWYFLSDEKIKEGDWKIVFDSLTSTVRTVEIHKHSKDTECPIFLNERKIIATTDESLKSTKCWCMKPESGGCIECNKLLPQPSQSFILKSIERYNADEPITDVMVEYYTKEDAYELRNWYHTNGQNNAGSAVRIPEKEELKVNSKDNTITIKPVKDSWNKEELRNILIDLYDNQFDIDVERRTYIKWIEENL